MLSHLKISDLGWVWNANGKAQSNNLPREFQYSRLGNFEPPGPQAANQRLIEQLARTSEL